MDCCSDNAEAVPFARPVDAHECASRELPAVLVSAGSPSVTPQADTVNPGDDDEDDEDADNDGNIDPDVDEGYDDDEDDEDDDEEPLWACGRDAVRGFRSGGWARHMSGGRPAVLLHCTIPPLAPEARRVRFSPQRRHTAQPGY